VSGAGCYIPARWAYVNKPQWAEALTQRLKEGVKWVWLTIQGL
jgi:hypothetical protein